VEEVTCVPKWFLNYRLQIERNEELSIRCIFYGSPLIQKHFRTLVFISPQEFASLPCLKPDIDVCVWHIVACS
jgi:hypothetical protein